MTAISRTFSLSYGSGVSVGGASAFYLIEGPIQRSTSYASEMISLDVVVTAASAADLETKCSSLLAGMRVPRQALTLTLGAGVHTWAEGTNAVGIDASISRKPGAFDTHTSRGFSLVFEISKNADAATDLGLVGYDYSVSKNPNGITSVSIAAQFTLYSGDDAEEVYAAQFDTLAGVILDEVVPSAEWEEGVRATEHDRFKRILSVSTAYTEQIFGENAAGTYESAIKAQSINAGFTLMKSSGAIRDQVVPLNLAIEYSCLVDKAVTQDLLAVYNSTVRALLLDYAQVFVSPLSPSLVGETYALDPVNNAIKASWVLRVYSIGDSGILESSIVTTYRFSPPAEKVPSYDLNGFARFILPSIGAASAVIEASVTVLGDEAAARAALARLPSIPTRTSLGGVFRATNNKPMSATDYNRIGIDGGEWTKDEETDVVTGPFFDDAEPQVQITGVSRVTVWDYSVSPAGAPLRSIGG